MNVVVMMGRLTKDPELRYTGSNIPVATSSIAVDDGYGENKKTYFFNIVSWRKTAEFLSKNFEKGNKILVRGKNTIREWEDKDGNKRQSIEIVCEEIDFVEKKSTGKKLDELEQKYPGVVNAGKPVLVECDEADGDLPF